MTSFLALPLATIDDLAMNPAELTNTAFLQHSADLLGLVDDLVQLELRPQAISLPTEDRVAVAAEVMLYCDKFRAYSVSRRAIGARASLLRVRRLYNF